MKSSFRLRHGLLWRAHYWDPRWDLRPSDRRSLIAILCILLLWAFASNRDYEEQLQSERQRCQRVAPRAGA